MPFNVKEAARLLGVSENRVRSYITSGKLTTERRGRQILIPETELSRLVEAAGQTDPEEGPGTIGPEGPAPPTAEVLERIDNRLTSFETQLAEVRQMAAENQTLHQLLRERDLKLAEKEREVEKLRRDLVYQKLLGEKELEGHRLAFQEQLTKMGQEAAARAIEERERLELGLERERQRLEEALIRERALCADKLAQEQQRFADTLHAMRNQEGFWAKLVRMVTWT